MRHRDIHSAKLPKFIEYYLQPNDPERFTMFTPNGWMIYKARTEEGSLFGRGRRSTLLKYVPDKDGNIITQVCYAQLIAYRAVANWTSCRK